MSRAVVSSWDVEMDSLSSFIANIVSLNDGLLDARLREVVLGDSGYLSKYSMEMYASAHYMLVFGLLMDMRV
jgi:hypothetical protein